MGIGKYIGNAAITTSLAALGFVSRAGFYSAGEQQAGDVADSILSSAALVNLLAMNPGEDAGEKTNYGLMYAALAGAFFIPGAIQGFGLGIDALTSLFGGHTNVYNGIKSFMGGLEKVPIKDLSDIPILSWKDNINLRDVFGSAAPGAIYGTSKLIDKLKG